MAKAKSLEKQIESKAFRDALKRRGFRVSRIPKELVPRTFKLPRKLLKEFYEEVARADLKLQDAVAQGLELWLSNR